MLRGDGFLGTGASLGADLALIFEVLFFVVLTIGVVAQRRGKYHWHDRLQIPVVLLNLLFIAFIMIASFQEQQVREILPQRPTDPYYLIVAIHAVLGTLAQLFSIYCLLAGVKILPRKVGTLRYWMWLTYILWILAVTVGVATYYVWYLRDTGAADIAVIDDAGLEPLATAEPGGPPPPQRVLMQNFAFAPGDITVVAGTEMTWLNQDGAPHNVTFDDDSVASENFFQGEAFTLNFDEVGTVGIYCTLHGSPGSGMAMAVTVVEATAENVAEVAAETAELPDPRPPDPTPAPVVPPAPSALLEEAVSASEQFVGVVSFFDTTAPSDSVNISLSGIVPAPAGSEYQAWLTNSQTGRIFPLGLIQPEADGVVMILYTDPGNQSLLDAFDGFQITQEPEFDDDPTPGPVAYSGRQATEAISHIRDITVRSDGTPNEISYAYGARLQAGEVFRHYTALQDAYDLLSIADAQRHAEHMLNIIEGTQGEFYGDLDGVHGIQDPGDGFGLLTYVLRMREAATAAGEAGDATNAVRTHSTHVLLATENALQWTTEIRTALQEIGAASSVSDIGPQVETIARLSQLLVEGEDVNGDGVVAPDEGAIFTAYQHAQYMAAVGVSSGADGAVVDAEPLIEASLDEQVALGVVVIDMRDFEYSPFDIAIPAGTVVRFINVGLEPHSATADNSSFDSTLLSTGGEFTFTFDEGGQFGFYCVLHGLPGGGGMSGTITVE